MSESPTRSEAPHRSPTATVHERAEQFITGPLGGNIYDFLQDCVEDGSTNSLSYVLRLFERWHDELMLRSPSAWASVCWGHIGLDKLINATQANPTLVNLRTSVIVLSTVAANFPDDSIGILCREPLLSSVKSACRTDNALPSHARTKLLELILSLPDEDTVLDVVAGTFTQLPLLGPTVAKETFAALSSRWLAVSKPLLAEYERLILDHPGDESEFQRFFSSHPQLLDPMAAEVWPQPDIHGAKKPDFVLRRFDNTYLVVEIETPTKSLVTKKNHQIAAPVTHAVSQATEYRRFIRRLPNVNDHFPGLEDIHCLVVVGLERELDNDQAQALRNDNLRGDSLRIVGFDWLAQRAQVVQENFIRKTVSVREKKRIV